MIGTAAISRPAVELDRCRSASVRVHQGPRISTQAKASMGRQWVRRTPPSPPWRSAKGSSSAAPSAQRVNTTIDGDRSLSTATLIIRYGMPHRTPMSENRNQPRAVMPAV
ncbi:hypothetical protein [Streptomyces sp. CC224B]|uniref:hypothetical protein n=1 Tax=Streptomyces sp. CC224B TaxID=3044571 RepID=UPI0024A7D583|nr:hypothetical protein [Streptomyces sp. CC224B]